MNLEEKEQGQLTGTPMARLTMAEFSTLSLLVYQQCGIKLPESKKIMLESRLNKRLRVKGYVHFSDYIKYLVSEEGMRNELIQMIDVVTTNKTDFFREPHHFDFMREVILPEFLQNNGRMIKTWSAACSTGEEPYSLAMVLQDFFQDHRAPDYSIFASDISTEVLKKAAMAIYHPDRIKGIPLTIKQKYFLKSKNQEKPTVRITPDLRRRVVFGRINFMDHVLPVDEMFDVIFCRNVLIYFDKQTQQDVLLKICNKLKVNGYLFVGHSESLFQLQLPLKQVKPTIYKRI
jgi:chemotaxis protein methyltransferase CheR